MKRPTILLLAALLLLFAAMEMKGRLIHSEPLGGAPAAGEFSEARAMARLQRILGDQRPHPVDSPAGDAVRDRLVAELRAIGLSPEVRDDIACNGHGDSRGVSCARVRNIVASLGPATGKRILLVSHYDSTPVGPGAADDGIGVAAMLETAALLKDRPLKRPVTLLFDEGEEAGLLGARAFLEHDPLAASVDAALNFESRGVSGPAIMFETSRPNGPAIAELSRSGIHPVANSMTADFYRLIPNSTDATVFLERPWTILNFAVIGNETRYHSPTDELAALDPASLRHMGVQALAATQALTADPAPAAPGSRLYADILGQKLVILPLAVGLVLLGGLLLLLAGLAWRERGGIGRATGAVTAALVASAALAFVGQWAVGSIRHGVFWRAHPETMSAALDLSAIAASVAMLVVLARRADRDRLRTAYWLVFLLLGAALSFAAPGASIFFLAPPLAAGLGLLAARRWALATTAGAWLACVVLFLSWAPLLHLSEVLLDFPAGWTFAPVAALIALPFLIELQPLIERTRAAMAIAAVAVAAALGWVAVALTPAYSADRKQAFGIEYAWDDIARKGRWLVVGDISNLPAALGPFGKREEVAWSSRKHRAAEAPPLPVPPPQVVKLAERESRGGRLLTLRLASNGAESVLLRSDSRFTAVRAGGSTRAFGTGTGDDPYILRCHGRSCDRLVLDLLVGKPPLTLTVSGVRNGLPAAAAPLLRARPANAQPQYSPDSTIAVTTIRL